TPMLLGISMTVLNLVLNVLLIPSFGTKGAAMGTCIASGLIALYSLQRMWSGAWVIAFPRHSGFGPNWSIIKSIFKFGLPTGVQGIAMNIGGVLMLSLITWTSVGLMGAAAAVAGQNLGAGQPDRADAAVHVAARFGFAGAAFVG